MRRLAVAAVLLLVASGCGSQRERYCSALKTDQKQLSQILSTSDPGGLITGLPTLKALGAKAPDELTDEWQTFLNAVEGLRDALDAAGVKPSQYRDGLPASVTGAKKQAVVDAADTLASDGVVDAANGIETQARDVCKLDLGL
ncbi:hypothetical protein D9V37_05750 [Nocardioides mangrovicus]|uniref:Lipoprotein n=1 Tax=Nocardioides mangrovicus TaxID=2478913 RepID=A0A3L8P599_9ACTN|nr:hypothetical protein [Nocardioides mangrovicus]RLV50222.1 hypothetical protein D9V37_05750 [Nocardioides mangrovicus]